MRPSSHKLKERVNSQGGLLIVLFLILSSMVVSVTQAAILPNAFRVVIDPGHGGADEGTLYFDGSRQIAEKDITLVLARQIAFQLRARGFAVHLTRKGDTEIPLPDRTALANRLGANLFLSIHVNSTHTGSSEAEGVETYILNNTSDASSRRLARIENSVISKELEETSAQPDVALILKDLRLDGNLKESKRLACQVQGNIVAATSSHRLAMRKRNRGVKQALFHVLLGADMPAILLEAGFLTHPNDRKLLLSYQGQLKISRAIANAVVQYRYDRLAGPCQLR